MSRSNATKAFARGLARVGSDGRRARGGRPLDLECDVTRPVLDALCQPLVARLEKAMRATTTSLVYSVWRSYFRSGVFAQEKRRESTADLKKEKAQKARPLGKRPWPQDRRSFAASPPECG